MTTIIELTSTKGDKHYFSRRDIAITSLMLTYSKVTGPVRVNGNKVWTPDGIVWTLKTIFLADVVKEHPDHL